MASYYTENNNYTITITITSYNKMSQSTESRSDPLKLLASSGIDLQNTLNTPPKSKSTKPKKGSFDFGVVWHHKDENQKEK